VFSDTKSNEVCKEVFFFARSHFCDVNMFIEHSAHFLFIVALGYLMSLAKYSDKVTALPVESDIPYNLPFEVHSTV